MKILRRPTSKLSGTANSASDNAGHTFDANSIIGATSTTSTRHEDDHEHELSEGNKNRTSNTNGQDVFGERLLTEPVVGGSRNDHDGGGINNSLSACATAITTTTTTANAIAQSHPNYHHNQNTLKIHSPSQQPQHRQHQQASSSDTNINHGGKNLMKTYQERADEYAKARLRILGSPFPENDTLTKRND